MSVQSVLATAKEDASKVPDAINALSSGNSDALQHAVDIVTAADTSARAALSVVSRRATVPLLTANTLVQTTEGLLDILTELESGMTDELIREAASDAASVVSLANTLAQEAMNMGGRRRKTRKGRGKKRGTRRR
jgi:hypothetical protein